MHTIHVCATAVLAACAPAARPTPVARPAPAPSASAIEGLYRGPHTTRYRCDTGDDGWCEVDDEDLMSVSDHGGGALGVHVFISAKNAHTCSFAGVLKAEATTSASKPRWVLHDEAADAPCTLTLEQDDRGLALHALGCRDYCGANAYLDSSFTLHD